jgi:pyrimidine-nucleoside phosphorylase
VVEDVLRTGAALDKLRAIVARQGGDPRVLDDLSRLGSSSLRVDVAAPATGYVQRMDAFGIGMAAVALGAGRQRMEDVIDRRAGIVLQVKRGARVKEGEPLAILHGNDPARVETARRRFLDAVTIGAARPEPRPLVRARVDADGLHQVTSIADVEASA